jgi:hypothetical protein
MVRVNNVNAIEEVLFNEMKVYPNPSKGFLNIELKGEFTYEMIDLNGRMVLAGKGSNASRVELGNLAEGLYRLQVLNEKGMNSENILVRNN